jgi:hypothetical protein
MKSEKEKPDQRTEKDKKRPSEETVGKQTNQQHSEAEEEEESRFGGLRGGKNFRKNLGCGG